ncbi:uncharacterized protein LOC129309749 [Prosopis cineraria]|uniref:uncharacterized protein LOC129309749 n=1 Tax=Prosopis cineraria TaxID=364024 RepID=UPI00241050D4|nr:uncharacterized protein LOC129309749 [Prosopis cineraria]
MGSLEEDELVRMVRDFIESESPSPAISSSSNCLALNHQTQYFLLQDVLRSETSSEAMVLRHVLKHMKGRRDTKRTSSLRKWLVKNLKIDGLHASLCQTSWSTSLGCPAGEYEFIEVINEDENGRRERLIVDIDFRSQFELARPTQDYREMIDSVPVIFVGNEDRLCKIISLLCSAAKQSLRQKGLHVPPWRTNGYMQSKWLSGCHKETENPRKDYRVARDQSGCGDETGKWVPPMVKPKKMDMASAGSALSCQFSNMSLNCCNV